MNVADLIVETLQEAGVERMYGVVGDSLNGLTEAIRSRGVIRWMHMRNEEAGAFAAGAEAQLTGKLTVCAGSCGPGHVHLINGLLDCHRTGAPVLAIAAHVPSVEIGSSYFQETKPDRLFAECSHYCELVSSPEQIPRVVELAIRAAVGLGGVAVLIVPGDVALRDAVHGAIVTQRAGLLPSKPDVIPPQRDLLALADLLGKAKRTTLLCGRGCAGAHAEVLHLADTLGAPIVHALGGKDHIEYDNPFDVGMTGLIGFSSGYQAMLDCDMLLMLGTNFPYRQFYPTKARIAQVDVRVEALGRRCRLDLGLVGDVRSTLRALASHLTRNTDRAHLDGAVKHYRAARESLDELATGHSGRPPIHPQFLTSLINEKASDDAIFTADTGTPTIWAARYLRMNGRRRLIGSWVHGSMANAMAQSIGAQAAFPGRQVISLSGDGGFAMLMGDFLTLSQLDLPVKVIVFNNGSLGFVELEMQAAGLLETGVALKNPDFAAIARAAGVHALRVEDPGLLAAAVAEILSHPGPALLDVVVNRHELAVPPALTAEQMKGFSLYVLKAVMSGRGDAIIDLAKTNLLR